MKIEVLTDADSVARAGAAFTAEEARAAVAARGRFIVAFSGGHTPWTMLRALAEERMPWAGVHVVQVDERVLGDAMHGDATLFAREDYVEEAWRIVDPVLKAGTPVYEYEPGTWGPKEVDSRVTPPGGWQNPTVKHI